MADVVFYCRTCLLEPDRPMRRCRRHRSLQLQESRSRRPRKPLWWGRQRPGTNQVHLNLERALTLKQIIISLHFSLISLPHKYCSAASVLVLHNCSPFNLSEWSSFKGYSGLGTRCYWRTVSSFVASPFFSEKTSDSQRPTLWSSTQLKRTKCRLTSPSKRRFRQRRDLSRIIISSILD